MGSPCEDGGERLPLHGTIANTPCERVWWDEDDETILIHAVVNDSSIFSRKLVLYREIACAKADSRFTVTDRVENQGNAESPVMLLYHMNMGYPLLSEEAVVTIPSVQVTPRNGHAAQGLDSWHKMLPPTPGFEEQCYYHSFEREGCASIYNPAIDAGLEISFDPEKLWNLTEWKMMGVRDYVLGLEPGNCTPDGRDVLRRQGKLEFLRPGESVTFQVAVRLFQEG